MIRTEYTRQVPVIWNLPLFDDTGKYLGHAKCITGYRTQRAWCTQDWIPIIEAGDHEKLMRGEEVEDFEWVDFPVKE